MIHLGVLGETLSHSLSPDINQYLMQEEHIQGSYHVLEMKKEDVPKVAEVMKMLNIRGLNVTIPYKETMMGYVDELSDAAKKIGALNTVYLKDGKTYGYNTDYIGILRMFRSNKVLLAGKRVTILGNGGAARAAAVALHDAGAAWITAAGRNREALKRFGEEFPFIKTVSYEEIPGGDIIMNTTPVGMYPGTGVSAVGRTVLQNYFVAADIVYNPLETEFLRLAKEEGLQTVTGLQMLIDQAIGSHEIWFDRQINAHVGAEIHRKLASSVTPA